MNKGALVLLFFALLAAGLGIGWLLYDTCRDEGHSVTYCIGYAVR